MAPTEAVDACLERIERLNPSIEAVVSVLADEAREEAARLERALRAGEAAGPLAGVPVGLKDVIFTAGSPTTGGSRIYRDFVPDRDAVVVTRLREAGAIPIAKLGTMEFNYGDEADAGFPPVRNPWNLDYYAGGSSSGSGAGVAARMFPLAIGEDTGGSLRLPSASCGIVGIKPTYGRVPRSGMMSLAWSMDHVGPMARSVTDVGLALQVLAGGHRTDATSSWRPVPDYLAAIERGVEGLTLGVPTTWFFDDVDPEVERLVRQAIADLEDAGAKVVDVDLELFELSTIVAWIVWGAELASLHEVLKPRLGEYGKSMVDRLAQGEFWSAQDYLRAQRVRHLMQRECQRAFRRVDALVTPAAATAAGKFEDKGIIARIGESERLWIDIAARLTSPFNLTGMPAIVIACGFTGLGLPVGLQVASPPHQDALALRIARAYERLAHGPRPIPPLLTENSAMPGRSPA